MTREEVAESFGISRKLAAFHLDKLGSAGLLRVGYASAAGIRKVGRRPKVYEPMAEALAVNIPERRYGMPADVTLRRGVHGIRRMSLGAARRIRVQADSSVRPES